MTQYCNKRYLRYYVVWIGSDKYVYVFSQPVSLKARGLRFEVVFWKSNFNPRKYHRKTSKVTLVKSATDILS